MIRIGFIVCIALACPLSAAAEPQVIDVWPDGPPGGQPVASEPETFVDKDPPDGIVRLTNVTRPTITVFRPEHPIGTAVLVCPGGGYKILAYEHEGTTVCEFLRARGVTAVLLKYRVPAERRLPLEDARRALAILRARAGEWGLTADRIGILGFSAGGHLALSVALAGQEHGAAAAPPQPDFAIAIYPAYLTPPGTDGPLLPEFAVTAAAPPLCLVHATDDPLSAAGSALVYLEYKRAKRPCELHIFAKGGHGFGMKRTGLPAQHWPERVVEWMQSMGYLPAAP
jgi:acetyl esterase/lipase